MGSEVKDQDQDIRCSFCRKIKEEVGRLIVSQEGGICICDECVSLASEILEQDKIMEGGLTGIELLPPKDIKKKLDEYVIGQDSAKKILAVAVYNHYKRVLNYSGIKDVEIQKSNIILAGPSGCGKTLLVETLSRILKVPCAICDVTTITETGYVGEDPDSIIYKLYSKAEGDVNLTEKGIILLDEIDKLSKPPSSNTRDVSGEGVQQSLLKMLEGCEVTINTKGNKRFNSGELITVKTDNILFICSGAFIGLDKIIEKRKRKVAIGFEAKEKTKEEEDIELEASPEDFIKYGLIPEFVGRVPIIAKVDNLKKEDYFRILTEPRNSITKQFESLFKIDNIKVTFNKECLEYIVNLTERRKTGARGIRSVFEKMMTETMFTSPSEKEKIKEIIVGEKGNVEVVYK